MLLWKDICIFFDPICITAMAPLLDVTMLFWEKKMI